MDAVAGLTFDLEHSVPNKLCKYRAMQRSDHLTLPAGSLVRTAMKQHVKSFVPPELSEGFTTVVRVPSFGASKELVACMSPAAKLLKFPQTFHLLNLGAATLDDLISGEVTVSDNARVVVTEKVDGANLGFSLSFDLHILVQNRSHFVMPSSHTQFRKLGKFIESHRRALLSILHRDETYAERYVLYGEWMAATHSNP
jgi:atypical dual specificity phosphatase